MTASEITSIEITSSEMISTKMTLSRMKLLNFNLVFVLMAVMCNLSAYAEIKSAITAVEENTRMLVGKLKEIKPLYESDKEQFYQEVENTLSPLIDFNGFSRGVMAKYYKRASPEQKQLFSSKFRGSLVRSYADALAEFDNQKMEVIPSEPGKDSTKGSKKNPNKATVKLMFHGHDGTKYPIDYSMVLSDDKWLLRNVVISGINVGLQFKSQFSGSMQKYNNDMDEVIKNWDAKLE